VTPVTTDTPAAKPASTIALLAGIWLFVSPWVYGAAASPNAWNSWIAGALIFIFAATRLSRSPAGVSWLNVILGIWTFVSPWVYGYTGNTGRFINSLCVGVIVFVAAMISANAMPHGTMSSPRHV
jgi:hypothetical protein